MIRKLFTFIGGIIIGFILGAIAIYWFAWAIGAFWKGR